MILTIEGLGQTVHTVYAVDYCNTHKTRGLHREDRQGCFKRTRLRRELETTGLRRDDRAASDERTCMRESTAASRDEDCVERAAANCCRE